MTDPATAGTSTDEVSARGVRKPLRSTQPRPVVSASLAAEYEAWAERVRATYEAITYTCHHRLRDRGLATQVGIQVVADLVARPGVFRYFGLPYSGRIARLAEARIAEARQGCLAVVREWPALVERLAALPPEHREVLVLTCVLGRDDVELASSLGCDEVVAAGRREATMKLMRKIAAPHLAATDSRDKSSR